MTGFIKRTLLALTAVLGFAGAAAGQTYTLPELGISRGTAGACWPLAIRDRSNLAMVSVGCIDTTAHGFKSTPNALVLPTTDQGSSGELAGMSLTIPAGPLLAAGQRTLPATIAALQAVTQRNFRFDPRNYGATCNASGTGDDAGVSAAITALQNAGGGTLLIPGKCVIASGKTITGVPVVVDGESAGTGMLVGGGSWSTSNGAFFLRIDITGGSGLTAMVKGLGFRTYQQETASALQIEANLSGLEERVIISDVEVRGDNIGSAGFSYGIQFKNVNSPRVSRTTVTGRQSGNGPSGLTNMNVCYDISTTGGGAGAAAVTNYGFSDTRCNAAKIGWNINGYIEGIVCTRCYAIAVGTGWYARPGGIVPLISISQSHADFFSAGVDMQYFSQSYFTSNLFYHRSDATSGGTCYYIANTGFNNSIIGGGCFESGNTQNTVGVVFDNSPGNLVSDVIFDRLVLGVNNTNGTVNTVYRRGQWYRPASGAGEFGNGGSTTNVCIGYNAAC